MNGFFIDGLVVGNSLCKIGHGDLNEVFIDSELKLDCEVRFTLTDDAVLIRVVLQTA